MQEMPETFGFGLFSALLGGSGSSGGSLANCSDAEMAVLSRAGQQYRCPQCDVPVGWPDFPHAETCTWEAEQSALAQNAASLYPADPD
jgi:hypothetical protein